MSFNSPSGSLYEEELNENNTLDWSAQKLKYVPQLPNPRQISALYLQDNELTKLPDDLFTSLPNLKWLDLRNNFLVEIPKSIDGHMSLTHLLLQNNNLKSLPNELGNIPQLTVLQVAGNPILYPPKGILAAGRKAIQAFLMAKYINESVVEPEEIFARKQQMYLKEDSDAESYSSVNDEPKADHTAAPQNEGKTTMTVEVSEKDKTIENEDEEVTGHIKCNRYFRTYRPSFPPYYQSAKYLKPLTADPPEKQMEKMKRTYLKDMALKKHKELLETRERVLQDRKNIELLDNWRKSYRKRQVFAGVQHTHRKYQSLNIPYDTSPEYMTLLSREDIEKDLPDKYRKMISRRPKPTIPRRNKGDVHLAIKIKKLFENLEAIDLNRETMTPRTEQKALMNEIQKITEIKNKLTELTNANKVI